MTTETEPRTSAEIGGMGHSVKRKEDPRFIRGRGEYIDDVNLPGQLWLDIVRSPYAHAKIVKIDSSKAMAIPGVLAVITGETLKKYNLHWMPTLMSDTQMVLPVEKVMHSVRRSGRRPSGHDGGRTGEGWQARSHPGRLLPGARTAVRLLHAGHVDDRLRAAEEKRFPE